MKKTDLIPSELTSFGFGSFPGSIPEPLDPEKVTEIRAFIAENLHPTQTINRRFSSYWLKHQIERAMGHYISNGHLIAALALEGYQIKRVDSRSPNAFTNVSYRAIKKLQSKELITHT